MNLLNTDEKFNSFHISDETLVYGSRQLADRKWHIRIGSGHYLRIPGGGGIKGGGGAKNLVQANLGGAKFECKHFGGGARFQNFSAQTSKGGASFQSAEVEGGGKISARRNLKITPPPLLVPINNDHSVRSLQFLFLLFFLGVFFFVFCFFLFLFLFLGGGGSLST